MCGLAQVCYLPDAAAWFQDKWGFKLFMPERHLINLILAMAGKKTLV